MLEVINSFDQWKYKDSVTYWKNYYLPFQKMGERLSSFHNFPIA